MSQTLNPDFGVIPSSWTTATRPASPTVGQQGWNTTLGKYEVFVGGTTWIQITS
jgi:hypothetical protein